MKNYLFGNLENGDYFFVECENETEINRVLLRNNIDPDKVVRCSGVYTYTEVEILGYNSYC